MYKTWDSTSTKRVYGGGGEVEIELPLFKELLVVENVKGYPVDKEARAVTPTEQELYSFLERRSGNDCECPVCTQILKIAKHKSLIFPQTRLTELLKIRYKSKKFSFPAIKRT